MTILGLSQVENPKVHLQFGMRTGWLRHIGIVIGGASGAAIVLGSYQIIASQPERSFAFLQGCGPAFLVSIVAIFLLGRFLEGLVGTLALGIQSQAEASGRTADALTRLADQGSRQAEQVERLAIYAAQEFPGVYERLDRQDEVLKQIARVVNDIGARMGRGTHPGGENGND